MKFYFDRLRELREGHELRQAEIAKFLGLTNQQAYQRYESGRVMMPINLIIKAAVFYDVSVDYVCGLTDDRRKYW